MIPPTTPLPGPDARPDSGPQVRPGTAPEIGGGGSIAVDTAEMLHAAAVLADARSGLSALALRAATAATGASASVRAPLLEAHGLLQQAVAEADRASAGLRLAAQRYGQAEHAAEDGLRNAAARRAAARGEQASTFGPLGVPLLLLWDVALAAGTVGPAILDELRRTGRVEPQLDPVVVRWLALTLSSLDDEVRGFKRIETPYDLIADDQRRPYSTAAIAAIVSLAIWPVRRGPVGVRATTRLRVARPGSLSALADRLPDGESPQGQIRIERYRGASGPRWIVYSAGTVTFSPLSGREPFDLESNVRGVGDLDTDSQDALLAAMRQSGIGRDDPVLVVGHSQGALNAVRIAQRSGYHVDGVVQFGGPTRQIAAPEGVAMLSVVHDQDLVPSLGGVAASGAAGLRGVVVRRSLPDGGRLPAIERKGGLMAQFPAHDMRNYRETLREAEAEHAPALDGLRRRLSGFLDGDGDVGESVRYRAERGRPAAPLSGPAAPAPTAAAAPVPPASR